MSLSQTDLINLSCRWGREFTDSVIEQCLTEIGPNYSAHAVLSIAIGKIIKENAELKKQVEELKNGK